MSKYNFDKSLPPQPFTGMLGVLWFYQEQAAADVLRHTKAWGPDDERLAKERFRLRGLEAVLRIMASIEKYWDKAPPTRMSIKEILAKHEIRMAPDPKPYVEPERQKSPVKAAPTRAADTFDGDDGEEN